MGSRGSGFAGGSNVDDIRKLLQEVVNRYKNIRHWSEIFDAQDFKKDVAEKTGVWLDIDPDGTLKLQKYGKINKDVKQLINDINETQKI